MESMACIRKVSFVMNWYLVAFESYEMIVLRSNWLIVLTYCLAASLASLNFPPIEQFLSITRATENPVASDI